ncbi:MAG: RNA polymerase subunit sigma-70 [Planctomycetes bacterium]|nr:RNA polymerase subunit sigma-70 [Planctomycetota bacterium]
MSASPHAITLCLQRLRSGEAAAANEMLPLVYQELRGLAGHLMRGDRAHTLQPTALVHEAWLKIAPALDGGASPRDRQHFLAVAATAMRQVLINHARDRAAQKRGGAGVARVPLDECVDAIQAETGDLVALNDLLERFAKDHPRPAQIVELRVFGGMLVEEVAAALDLAESTVKADWRFARAWLQQAMPGTPDRRQRR